MNICGLFYILEPNNQRSWAEFGSFWYFSLLGRRLVLGAILTTCFLSITRVLILRVVGKGRKQQGGCAWSLCQEKGFLLEQVGTQVSLCSHKVSQELQAACIASFPVVFPTLCWDSAGFGPWCTQRFSHGFVLSFLTAICDCFEKVPVFICPTLPRKLDLKIF